MITTTTDLNKDDATATITVPVAFILERSERLGYPIDRIEDVALVWSRTIWLLHEYIGECLEQAITLDV